jgi:hypothetical protein
LPPDLAACGVLPEFERYQLVAVRVFQKPVALVIDILLISGYPEIGVDCHFTGKWLFQILLMQISADINDS